MSDRKETSSEKLHPITFCTECSEAIPMNALACFHCGSKQAGEKPAQVVFCEKCGQDHPIQAHSCFHCGHVNPNSSYLAGAIRS